MSPAEFSAWEPQLRAISAAEHSDAAHDGSHVARVVLAAKRLARLEGARLEIVIPAASLHDCVALPKNSPDWARASALAGHTPGWRSARYSRMARESQTTRSPWCRHGTRPEGEKLWKSGPPDVVNGTSFSAKSSPSVRISTQGRIDQEE